MYINLADEEWRGLRIDSSRWRVVSDPPVKFVQPKGLLPLPEPAVGLGSREKTAVELVGEIISVAGGLHGL